MMTRRELGVLGGSFGVAIGVSLAASSLAGLTHQGHVGAAPGQHPTSPPATVQPSRPGQSPASPPSSSPSAAQQLGADTQRLSAGPGPVPQQPVVPSPKPSPSPTHASGCSDTQFVTVSLPTNALPCSTIRVARVARIGGTR